MNSKKTSVVDYYLLRASSKEVEEAEVLGVQEKLWSLQYAVPGVVTAFLGEVGQCQGANFDFAVVYRFSNSTACERFVESDMFRSIRKEDVSRVCSNTLSLVVQMEIESELDTLFRRGQTFEEGCDCLLVTRLSGSASSEDCTNFLAALCEISALPEFGGAAASVGKVINGAVRHGLPLRQSERVGSFYRASPRQADLGRRRQRNGRGRDVIRS